jgi:hypothetical protein
MYTGFGMIIHLPMTVCRVYSTAIRVHPDNLLFDELFAVADETVVWNFDMVKMTIPDYHLLYKINPASVAE